MQTFEFVFTLHLIKNILGINHELSQALQRSDQDIVNVMNLVSETKQRLQAMRDDDSAFSKLEGIGDISMKLVEIRKREIFYNIENEQIIQYFQIMKIRREQL
uniref:Uncharacterized protein n=1 Tax=Cajanus cajan TaxID=3821 RepID=A0A151U0V8_CAJCA|nr:hypothetical protein KK1_005567 [Cajanus cajan]